MRKCQVSLEYLMVVALSFMLLIPGLYLMLEYTRGSTAQILQYQVSQIGKTLVESAQTVDGYGKDAMLIIKLELPSGITNISANGNFVMVTIGGGPGKGTVFFKSSINITTTFVADDYTSGPKSYRVLSRGDYVSISRV